MQLDVKLASKNEKKTLFFMVHDMWPHHPDRNTHTELRLSEQHKYAKWYVGTIGENITCGLGIYEGSLTHAEDLSTRSELVQFILILITEKKAMHRVFFKLSKMFIKNKTMIFSCSIAT